MIRTTILSLALCIGAPAVAHSPTHAPGSGEFAVERLAVPQVTLIDQHARAQEFHGPLTEGRLLVINFSYTNCDTICPMGNDVMAELDALLPPDAPVRLLSISIDPARDTPAQMHKTAQLFGASDRWSWLTGTPSEVSRLLVAFDADVANFELHEPIFLVGDLATERFHRSQSMPYAEELAELVASLTP